MTSYSRDRRQNFTRSETYLYWDRFSGPSPPFSDSFSYNLSDHEDFIGDDLLNWRQLIRLRDNAQNHAVANRTRVIASLGTGTYSVIQYVWEGDPIQTQILARTEFSSLTAQMASCPIPVAPSGSSVASDMAKAQFVSKARKKMSPTSGGVVIGEIRETIRLIRNPAKALRDSISGYLDSVKKQSRGMKKATNRKKNAMVSNTWLEYSFGWTPLLSDIDSAAESLARIATKIPPNEEIRAYGKYEELFGQYETSGTMPGGGITYWVTEKETYKTEIYGAINRKVDPLPSFRSSFGLRPHDIIPTIWELIPYSFVVDYFTNIGDIISTASFNTSYLAWWGESSVAERSTQVGSFYYNNPLPPSDKFITYSRGGSPGAMKATYKRFERTRSPLLVPSLRLSIPGTKGAYFNLAALIGKSKSIRF